MIPTNKQTEYLKLVQSVSGSPIFVTNLIYNSSVQKWTPGKHYNLNHFEIIDDRTVCINEIIYDFDFISYTKNAVYARKVLEVLFRQRIKPVITDTGGKGIHIHTWFKPITFTNEKNKELFKEALSYGMDWKHIRLWYWNKVLDEAGIEENLRGKGKQIDSAPMTFNYHSGTSHLIREIGGRKIIKDSIEDRDITTYKNFIAFEDFKGKKTRITNFDEVNYPEKIEMFEINEVELVYFLTEFVRNCKKNNEEQLSNDPISVKYTQVDGVLKLREGMPLGKRNGGAAVLSIACKIDGLTKEEATIMMQEYVNNCEQMQHAFTIQEATQWLEWIYKHETPFWNCSLLEELEVHNTNSCECCQAKHKDSIKLLTNKGLLNQIIEVLDEEIIGEIDTKILIFLLCLSKDFPSPTGRPGWNIPGDPMSQNIILSSDSSSGKSYIVKKIIELFGEEDKDFHIVSRLSKNALNYYTDQNMDGKIIFIEEMQGLDENTNQLRVWMSEGRLSLQTVEDVLTEDGREVKGLVKKSTKGQPCFITNQAEGEVGEQLLNRSWILSLDTTIQQSENILVYQNELNKNQKKFDSLKKRRIKDAIKQLKQYHFIIPFADHKLMRIPTSDIRVRRDYNKFLTLIKCSAYLHQKQRRIVKDEDGKEFIITSIKDYDIARMYCQGILGATFSGLTTSQVELLSYLKNSSFKESFTINTLIRNLGKTQPHWFNTLKQLNDLGYVSLESTVSSRNEYSLNTDKVMNLVNLPTGKELVEAFEKQGYNLYNQIRNFQTVVQEESEPEIFKKLIEVIVTSNSDKQRDNIVDDVIVSTTSTINNGINRDNVKNNPDFFFTPVTKTPEIYSSGVTYKGILEYISKNNKNLIPVQQIQAALNIEEKELNEALYTLKGQGEIYEPRTGYVMILK